MLRGDQHRDSEHRDDASAETEDSSAGKLAKREAQMDFAEPNPERDADQENDFEI